MKNYSVKLGLMSHKMCMIQKLDQLIHFPLVDAGLYDQFSLAETNNHGFFETKRLLTYPLLLKRKLEAIQFVL